MKVRYKASEAEAWSRSLNVHSMNEVLTGDDTVPIPELDVWVNGAWKDMGQAFRDRDIIPDNYNKWFGEPRNEVDRKRGYFD